MENQGEKYSMMVKKIKEATEVLEKLKEENRKKAAFLRVISACDETGGCHLPVDLTSHQLEEMLVSIDEQLEQIHQRMKELEEAKKKEAIDNGEVIDGKDTAEVNSK